MPEDSASAVRGESRRLAAIMFTDSVGLSRQMGADEVRMLRLMDVHNQMIRQAVALGSLVVQGVLCTAEAAKTQRDIGGGSHE